MVRFSNTFTKFELLFRFPQLYILSFIIITIKIIISITNKMKNLRLKQLIT